MEQADAQYAHERIGQLKATLQVDVTTDWGYKDPSSGMWQKGSWLKDDLDRLHDGLALLANAMGGLGMFVRNLGGVTVQRTDIGSHEGEALAHLVSLTKKGSFTPWTIVHEFAHAWDANHNWKLSAALEKYTGGYTNRFFSRIKKLRGGWDTGPNGEEDAPGRRGRKPGCNAAGYFYGDKPSGSNWRFNRKEDFAESVAMYVGWNNDNALSQMAHGRIKRYLLPNGEKDKTYGVADNWADYAKYFYPEQGDYTKTKRWQFIDELMRGKLSL